MELCDTCGVTLDEVEIYTSSSGSKECPKVQLRTLEITNIYEVATRKSTPRSQDRIDPNALMVNHDANLV